MTEINREDLLDELFLMFEGGELDKTLLMQTEHELYRRVIKEFRVWFRAVAAYNELLLEVPTPTESVTPIEVEVVDVIEDEDDEV